MFLVTGDRSGKRDLFKLPHISTIIFIVLCIFRAVFMFLYPKGFLSFFLLFFEHKMIFNCNKENKIVFKKAKQKDS